jgi:hypothetical protein
VKYYHHKKHQMEIFLWQCLAAVGVLTFVLSMTFNKICSIKRQHTEPYWQWCNPCFKFKTISNTRNSSPYPNFTCIPLLQLPTSDWVTYYSLELWWYLTMISVKDWVGSTLYSFILGASTLAGCASLMCGESEEEVAASLPDCHFAHVWDSNSIKKLISEWTL